VAQGTAEAWVERNPSETDNNNIEELKFFENLHSGREDRH
jgi:hypothetical protein